MLLRGVISKTKQLYVNFESNILSMIFGNPMPPGLCYACVNEISPTPKISPTLENIFQSAFLFAVPKSRRTLEKRKMRRFGVPNYHWKPLVPKQNLLMCDTCGNDYEAGHLCGYCYNQVKRETEEMQKAIEQELHLNPIDKEVIVVYEGEAVGKPEHFWKGKRIVEMKKQRPAWFSDNLLQKSTIENSSDKDTKPDNLA